MKKNSYGIRRRTSSAVTAGDVEGATKGGRGLSHSDSLAYRSLSRDAKIASVPKNPKSGMDRTARDLAWYKHAFKILFGTVLIVTISLGSYSLGRSGSGVHTHRSLASNMADDAAKPDLAFVEAAIGGGIDFNGQRITYEDPEEPLLPSPGDPEPLSLEELFQFPFSTTRDGVAVQKTLKCLDVYDVRRKQELETSSSADYLLGTIMEHGKDGFTLRDADKTREAQ